MNITLWQVVSIPFWGSGAVCAIHALSMTFKKDIPIAGGMLFDFLLCGLCWYIAARIAG
jgi:hypothetical protein